MIRNAPRGAAVYGVDLGKNVFHVVGVDDRGAVVQRVKFRRDTMLAFFERAEHALVGMEACPGSQWLARKLLAMGHEVRTSIWRVPPSLSSNLKCLAPACRPATRHASIKTDVQTMT